MNIRKIIMLALALFLVEVALAAESQPESSSRMHGNAVVTNDKSAFIKAWQMPGTVVRLPIRHTIKKNEHVDVVMIFAGCQKDKNGSCNVSVQYHLLAPDNTKTETAIIPLWIKAPIKENQLMLGDAAFNVMFDEKDPIGKYKVVATVYDNVDGNYYDFDATFTLE